MPTAGRLVAAVLFGALTFYVSGLALPLFPEATDPPMWTLINAGFGVLMGWIVAGSRAGTGVTSAIGYGITTVAAITFWAFFAHNFIEMLERSWAKRYDGPMEAVTSVFELSLDMAALLYDPKLLATFVVGGIIAALITDAVGRRLP